MFGIGIVELIVLGIGLGVTLLVVLAIVLTKGQKQK
jgi:hypothetical protein